MFFEYRDWNKIIAAQSISVLSGLVRLSYEYADGIVLIDDGFVPNVDTAKGICFPKLGPKSWRDTGSGKPVLVDASLKSRLDGLLCNVSDQQGYVAREIARSGEPLYLYLFEWVNYSRISEFRVTVERGEFRLSSSCQRSNVRAGYRSNILAFAREIASEFSCSDLIIDVAYLPSGECKLVEVNPPNCEVSLQGASSFVRLRHV